MENTWQMKCSSTWQPVTPLMMASSPQPQPQQEFRNQMSNTGHYYSSQVAQQPSSASRGMIQEPMFSKTSDLSSYNSDHASLGSSFLSLLSGPPSLLQCEFDQVPVSRPFTNFSKGSVSSCSSASKSGISRTPTGFLSDDAKAQNPNIRPDICPVLPPRMVTNASCSNTSGFGDAFQQANLKFQGSLLDKAGNEKFNEFSSLRDGRPASMGHCSSAMLLGTNYTLLGNEKVNGFASFRDQRPSSTGSNSAGKLHSTNFQACKETLLQKKSSLSRQSSAHTSCPRVFCLGSSGDLLLSNTGLLGVLCSCHGLHMSVSRFSEHSGLSNLNPGDAVHMDSGETIAQWRKLYFHKFGIRVPEDHSGWDWPEGFQGTASLVKHGATQLELSKNLDPSNMILSSKALVGLSRESYNNGVSQKNMNLKLVNEGLHGEKQINNQGSSILRPMANKQKMHCPVSEYSTLSKLVGIREPDNDCKNSKTDAKDSHVSRLNYPKEGGFVKRDSVSSNIELRLGQPSQQYQTSENLDFPPVSGSRLFDQLGVTHQQFLPELVIHNTTNTVLGEKGRPYLQFTADAPSSSARREQNQLNLVSHASGVNNLMDLSKIEQFNGEVARDSVISMLLSHVKTLEGKLQSRESNNEFHGSENHVPLKNCEPHIAKYESNKYGWKKDTEGAGRILSSTGDGFLKHMDKAKGVGCVADGCKVAPDPSFEFPAKHIKRAITCNPGANKTDHHSMTCDGGKLDPVTGLKKWCGNSSLLCGTTVHSKEDTPFQLSHDSPPIDQSLLRLSRGENHTTPLIEHAKCCQKLSFTCFQGKCNNCSVHRSIGNFVLKGKPSDDATENAGTLGQKFTNQIQNHVDFHGFQWKDVSKKTKGMCSVVCEHQPDLLDKRVNIDCPTTAARHLNQDLNSLKEHGLSNISSGSSASAVSQPSVEVFKINSCTVDAAKCKYRKNLVVDEGSGIDKCWSSDDAPESERSTECLGSTNTINLINERSYTAFNDQSSRSLIDEIRIQDSLMLKKFRKQVHSGHTTCKNTIYSQDFKSGFKSRKSEKSTKGKVKVVDASFPSFGISTGQDEFQKCDNARWHSLPSKGTEMLPRPDQRISHNCTCSTGPNFKRRRSELSSSQPISLKRDFCRIHDPAENQSNYQKKLKGSVDSEETPEVLVQKKCGLDHSNAAIKQFWMQQQKSTDTELIMKDDSVYCVTNYFSKPPNVCKEKGRPIICGKYGIISNGNPSKPAKMGSLRQILKGTTRYKDTENDKSRFTSAKAFKKAVIKESDKCFVKSHCFNKERDNKDNDAIHTPGPDHSEEQTKGACFSGSKEDGDVSDMSGKKRDSRNNKKYKNPIDCPSTQMKPKCREKRKRSLSMLAVKEKDSSSEKISPVKMSLSESQIKSRSMKDDLYQSSTVDVDAFCCVCGSSDKDDINRLLECSQCLIRVHQACYGVSKVPKTHWLCRPCQTSSRNIVCVLCGYGGGAMTRALRSDKIVNSLLKAWNIVTEVRPKYARSGHESDSFIDLTEASFDTSKIDSVEQYKSVKNFPCSSGNQKVENSITAGFLDSAVKQWVHMVCGLWTPGTRCPNVDTMSAFDVSGASHCKVNVVCSLCSRPGGCCIQCRVADCSVQFHPWCAHKKGLLQSEVEGVDNESVGFYGRCTLHAKFHKCDADVDHVHIETGHSGDMELTCARTEGYKGRKREGFRHNYSGRSSGEKGCLVPQEQLNAWLHIQKTCTKGLPKLPTSDIEHDTRKEYARYKQSKGWKHLVVYKSGIHALGLYTSRFISRSEMVVEYVGEIVGLRVADKRESEYQSGRKLQYKSACYFFRIDKEHIIDATCKGGIARFVNHSCLPNCVAKVISIRNEKKVVFFAERDIYPGEEITYDYHFNNEDEGKKIPCFCNAKNCRRFLN